MSEEYYDKPDRLNNFPYDKYFPTTYDDNDRFKSNVDAEEYNTEGGSPTKKKPSDSTTMTDPLKTKKYDSTGWTWSHQPTSNPDGEYWDSPHSTAREGENMGIYPSYGNKICKASDANPKWISSSDNIFGKFIDNLFAKFTLLKKAGFDKLTAIDLIHKAYPYIFIKFTSAESIVERFANKVYGTQIPKCETESLRNSINSYINELWQDGCDSTTIFAKLQDEYGEWLQNSRATRDYVISYIHRLATSIIYNAADIIGKKIKLIESNFPEYIILDVLDETPDYYRVEVYKTASDCPLNGILVDTAIIVDRSSLTAKKEAARISSAQPMVIYKTTNFYLNHFTNQVKEIPVPYHIFKKWSINENIPSYILPELEQNLYDLSFILINADKEVYISDDKSAVEVLDVPPDKAPESITNKEGKQLKKRTI